MGDAENTGDTNKQKNNATSGMPGHLVGSSTGGELNKPARTSIYAVRHFRDVYIERQVGTRSTSGILLAAPALGLSESIQQKKKV